jgi:predicted DNA-binding ribbon-helix-helix protein
MPIKRSMTIAGHRTSITLEEPFWDELKKIAKRQNVSADELVTQIDKMRNKENLSSAIRVFILNNVRHTHQSNY